MRKYELTIVIAGGTTPAKKKSIQGKIEEIVTAAKGKVSKVEDWGERDLAYPIAKKDTGIFLHFPLELESDLAKTLDSKLNLEEDIVRYLLIRKDPPSHKATEGQGK
jgi:small subunit ribosomal protein S6